MTDISRRNVLKGIAALAAVPVIGIPEGLVEPTPDDLPPMAPMTAGLFRVYCHADDLEFTVWLEEDFYDFDTKVGGRRIVNWNDQLALPREVKGYGNDVTPGGCCVAIPAKYGDKVIVVSSIGTQSQLVGEGVPMEMWVGTDGPYPHTDRHPPNYG